MIAVLRFGECARDDNSCEWRVCHDDERNERLVVRTVHGECDDDDEGCRKADPNSQKGVMEFITFYCING